MRKYLVLILSSCMLLSSCSEAKQAESIKKKSSVKTTVVIRGDDIPVKKPDFNKLTFKAQLSQEEKKYFQDKNKDFSERVKQYAIYYGINSTEENAKIKTEELCKWIVQSVNELPSLDASKEREREREREDQFYYKACDGKKTGFLEYYAGPDYWEYFAKKIPDSAQPFVTKANLEKRIEREKGNYKSIKPYNLLKEAIAQDPEDLLPYVYLTNWYTQTPQEKSFEKILQEDYKEYCRKAVELKQWDHIYYLSEGEPSGMTRGVEYIMRCLETKPDEYNYKYCKCPEATRMAVSQWPKHALYSGYLLDPTGEDGNGNLREGAIDFVNDLMKKYFGRDLTKEPKVYYYKGDPGR